MNTVQHYYKYFYTYNTVYYIKTNISLYTIQYSI